MEDYALLQWVHEVFNGQSITDAATDPHTAVIPVLALLLLWKRIGGFKSLLFSLLSFMVLLATWHEITINASAGRMLLLCGLSLLMLLYFVYLLVLRGQIRD